MINFSFILPVYNCKAYIVDIVRDIVAIGIGTSEVFLIDDGSSDGSAEICDTLSEYYDNVRCIHQSNRGVSAARNAGLASSRGDYVIFLDADDSFDVPGMKSALSSVLKNKSVDMVVYGLEFDYYHHSRCYRKDTMLPPFGGETCRAVWQGELERLFDLNMLSSIWNKIVRRKVITDNSLTFREDMILYEDLEFSLRCMAKCENILFIQEPIYHYRQAEDKGKAGHRVKKIDSISDLVRIIHSSLIKLTDSNVIPNALFLTLAREKISFSKLNEIKQICKDYSNWTKRNGIDGDEPSFFPDNLIHNRFLSLWLHDKYIKIRHMVAVKYKFYLSFIR